MNKKSLKNKTVGGFIWVVIERFGGQAIRFIISIILARLLLPKQFGLIGMLAVFIAISHSLIDSGFSQAIIRKKDVNQSDYSSVFYLNLGSSILIYIIIYFAAPLIASFYHQDALIPLVRVLGIEFIITSFSLVQTTILTKKMDFKKLMIIRLPSTIIGGIFGIYMAYTGWGVWSLVIQQISSKLAFSIQIWIYSKWTPSLTFDLQEAKNLFSFGSRLMVSGILDTVYKNIYLVVIGKFFAMAEVGYYFEANKIKDLPITNISRALDTVTYPLLSEIQNDTKRLVRAYKKILQQVTFWIFPIMVGAIILAQPLFKVFLTEKWLPAVPYFQLLCITGMMYPVSAYNLNILKVRGRSDLFLKLEIFKKIIITIGIIISLPFGVMALVLTQSIISILSLFINIYFSGKLIDYGFWKQIGDLKQIIIVTLLMGLIMFGIQYSSVIKGAILQIIVIGNIGLLSYLLISYFMNISALFEFKSIFIPKIINRI